ncbi:MAG: MFS transporter [Candidatus Epulonipiscioides saccharophilum]|nr:MAG: MFS transporter [Epulopiscium sp. AS2M-Bin001]
MFSKLERYWILYDVGNSAFILLTASLLPICFSSLAEKDALTSVDYLSYWGYAISIVTILIAILGPILGTISDNKNYKRKFFLSSVILGGIGCACLGFTNHWFIFLLLFMLAKFGVSTSLIFYDSMLNDITSEERIDVVSTNGYAWGYIGSCIPFCIGIALIFMGPKIGISSEIAMAITFLLVALWWIALALPLIKNYKQIHYVEVKDKIIKRSFSRLIHTLKDVKNEKHIFLFLLAFFFYIDGVYTIIDMATVYGEAIGLNSNGLLMALLVTQIVAFPSSIAFGILSKKVSSGKLIKAGIIAYGFIAFFSYFITTEIHFWILAMCVGLFQGGIQGMSRAYYSKIIPAEKSGEYFGLLDICGKGASFVGTILVSTISQVTGNIHLGISAITILFVAGFFVFHQAEIVAKEQSSADSLEAEINGQPLTA